MMRKKEMALYITLPGYQGLYFQGACGILMERWHFHKHGFLENGVIRCRTNQNRHRKSWQNVPLKTVYSVVAYKLCVGFSCKEVKVTERS